MNFEILIAFLLAGVVVFGGVYMLMNRFFKQESERRAYEWRKQNNDIVLPIRLRAYERIVLFLSRIEPKSLLLRFDFAGMTVLQLQQMLLRDDQTILGIKNEDSNDIARSAKVSASESIDASQPKNILSGVAYDKIGGVENRWVALASSKPSITLSWDFPKKISSVQFTFFSGSNEIAQTQSAYILKNMHRGPQKDLVRDFNLVAILEDGSERELCQVRQNAQRLVRLNFDSISVKALRADFLATNGSPKVVVNEIRVYA